MRLRTRITLASFASALVVLVPQPTSAHEPYGGCDEAWQAPTSEGARHCRERHGWTTVTTQRWTQWWPWWGWFR